MDRLTPYYRVRHAHREIFGTDDPQSAQALNFVLEAPYKISGIHIHDYVEYLPFPSLRDPSRYREDAPIETYQITPEEDAKYPYRILAHQIVWGGGVTPFLLQEIPSDIGSFKIIEGHHRFRIWRLLYHVGLKRDPVPCLVVDCVDDMREDKGLPPGYEDYVNWAGKNHIVEWHRLTEKDYAQFIHSK